MPHFGKVKIRKMLKIFKISGHMVHEFEKSRINELQ